MSRSDTEHHEQARRAIALAIVLAGGQQIDLMRKLNAWFKRRRIAHAKTKAGIHYWLTEGALLKPFYWPAIESITGGVVNRCTLRPDLFPPAPEVLARQAREIAARYQSAHAA